MRKSLVILAFVMFVVSSAFSLSIVDTEDGSFSLCMSGIPSFYYDLEADADLNEDVAGFELSTFWLGFIGDYKDFSLMILPAYEYGSNQIKVYDLSIKYKVTDNFSVKVGYSKTPFGRFYNSSGTSLLMYKRNPLFYYFTPGSKVGVTPEVTLMDGKIKAAAGIYNGYEFERTNDDNNLDFTGSVHIMPFGKMAILESAFEGYDEMKLDIVPGFCFEKRAVGENDSTRFAAGCHVAYRLSTLSVDALYYMQTANNGIEDAEDVKSMGYSGHVAYAINGKIEPAFRYSVLDVDTDVDDNTQTTIEFGTTYYINGLNSRIGLYYSNITLDGVDDPIKNEVRVFYAVQL